MADPEAGAEKIRDKVAGLERQTRALHETVRAMGNNNRNTNVMHAGGAGIWVAVTCCVVVLVMMLAISGRVTDLRTDMQAERGSRERMDNWTAQEVTAIRSYITNGRLAPMQPRPITTDPEPKP